MIRRGIMFAYLSVLNILLISLWVGIFNMWDIVDHKPALYILSIATVFDLVVTSLVLFMIKDDRKRDQLEYQ